MKKTLLAALALLAASPASANLIIDSFDFGDGSAVDGVDGGAGVFTTDLDCGGECIGGFRDLFANRISGTLPSGETTTTVEGGLLSFSNDALTTGVGGVRYDGFGSAGLGGFDLTAAAGTNGSFLFDVVFADLSTVVAVGITDESLNSDIVTADITETILTPTTIGIGFNQFSGVDLTDVRELDFVFGSASVAAVDLAVNEVTTVPVPGSLALFGAGLLAAAGFASRRAAQA